MVQTRSKVLWVLGLLAGLATGCGDDAAPAANDGGADLGADAAGDGARADAARGYSAAITAAGGTYALGDGITVEVPPNAVQKDVTITITPLSAADLAPILDARGLPPEALLFAFDAKPEGLAFAAPIHLIAPAQVTPGSFPIVHALDLANGTASLAETTVRVDPGAGTIDFALRHFSGYSAAEIAEFKRRGDEYCKQNPCRCGLVESKQSDKESICNTGECEVFRSKLESTFFDCPGQPKESSTFTELDGKCVPELTLGAARAKIAKRESTTVTAQVKLACDELEGETVTFELVSGPAGTKASPDSGVTDADGEARTTLTAGAEPGFAEVSAAATVSYSTFTVTVSAGGMEETVSGPQKSETLAQQTTVEIEDVERWRGTLDYEHDLYWPGTWHLQEAFAVELEFSVSGDGGVSGTATATQAASVVPLDTLFSISSVDVPATVDLVIDGNVDPDGSMYLVLKKNPEAPLWTFTACTNPTGSCSQHEGLSWLTVGLDVQDQGKVTLAEGTYQNSYTPPPFLTETETHSYTLTLSRDTSAP